MEPLEQNLALFSFLSYIVTKLDKIIEKSRVLNKVNGAMFEKLEKSDFFHSREGTKQSFTNSFVSYTVG